MYSEVNLGPALFGFALTLIVALLLVTPLFRRWRSSLTRTRIGILISLVVAILILCPFSQPLIFEPLDRPLNDRFRDRAGAAGLTMGMTNEEVKAILGKPDSESSHPAPYITDAHGHETWRGESYEEWDYKPLPLYWMGSKFQVFFDTLGRVSGFEANDD